MAAIAVIGGKVTQHGLLVSKTSQQPFLSAAKSFNTAPTRVSVFMPHGLRSDSPRVKAVTPLEKQMLGL